MYDFLEGMNVGILFCSGHLEPYMETNTDLYKVTVQMQKIALEITFYKVNWKTVHKNFLCQ